jgi:hypothetical protein
LDTPKPVTFHPGDRVYCRPNTVTIGGVPMRTNLVYTVSGSAGRGRLVTISSPVHDHGYGFGVPADRLFHAREARLVKPVTMEPVEDTAKEFFRHAHHLSRYADTLQAPKPEDGPLSAMKAQVGGDHYKNMKVQPIEYILANRIPFAEGNIIKYVSRWKNKNGVQDLKKARHMLDVLIEDAEKEVA